MAIAHFALVPSAARNANGAYVPALGSVPVDAQTLTSFGTVQTLSISCPAGASGLLWSVSVDTACYVTFDGTTPRANEGFFLPEGGPVSFDALPGQTPKIVTA